ncbi:MAG: peptidase M48, partial [Bacteroidetes bacterium]
MKNTAHLRLTALFFVAIAFVVSCAVNPVTGKKEFMLMSQNQEKALGASYDPQVIQQFGLYED